METTVRINGYLTMYALAENIGITGSRPIIGFISLNQNQLTVSASVGSAINENLKKNIYFNADVSVYPFNSSTAIVSGRLTPFSKPAMIKQGYTYIGEITLTIPKYYDSQYLNVKISVSYIHDTGGGLTHSSTATYSATIRYDR